MTVMVKVEVKEKRRGRKEDMEQRRGDSGSGQCRNASWAVRYTMALLITNLDIIEEGGQRQRPVPERQLGY
jgi:hypothetical protein